MNRSTTFINRAVAFLAITSVCGCQGDPYADYYTRTKPKISNLAGTYVLSRQTLSSTPIQQLATSAGVAKSPHTLVLHRDGAFTVTNIPVWIERGPSGTGWAIREFRSGTGQMAAERAGDLGIDVYVAHSANTNRSHVQPCAQPPSLRDSF